MARFKWFSLVLVLVLLFCSVTQAQAQTYSFQVESTDVVVFINSDGTISIDYTLVFLNDASADAIDYVDIGLPNEDYDISSIQAEVNGQSISDIQRSSYVDHGVALGLGSRAIRPGARGTVHAYIGTVRNVLYPGTQKETEAYASFQFTPNSFGSKYVHGTTNYQVTLVLPAGMNSDQPRYYTPEGWPGTSQPESGFDNQGRVFYRWTSANANAYSTYKFGAAFPASLVPAGAIVQPPAFSINWDSVCPFLFCLGFCGFFFFIIYVGIVEGRKRKLQYMPPKIAMEGHGIKRGLTAVEVAVLMEQPLDKVLTMILFGLLKKNAAEVTQKDPLQIKAADPLPEGLYEYETDFLAAFKETRKEAQRKGLQDLMVNLVKSLSEKMRGFSRKETLDYYQTIMQKAWEQVEAAATPEVKGQLFEENLDWTMLDRKFQDRTRTVFSGPVLVPMPSWWGRFDPTFRGSATPATSLGGGGSSSSHGGSFSLPGSDFAASVVNGVSAFSAGVIGDLTNFTNGVTNKTNPPPPPSTYRGGGGGGGRSCACACACAGCACACAGGGR